MDVELPCYIQDLEEAVALLLDVYPSLRSGVETDEFYAVVEIRSNRFMHTDLMPKWCKLTPFHCGSQHTTAGSQPSDVGPYIAIREQMREQMLALDALSALRAQIREQMLTPRSDAQSV
eukprot:3327865-Rhodomonas_salina.1